MTLTPSPDPNPEPKIRYLWLDLLRGAALPAMASYHFLWDLGDFGYIDNVYPATGFPRLYARAIASTFLFLAGFSFVLSHGNGIRWKPYFRRLGQIALSAILVTAAFYIFVPNGLVFFGILHEMALASVIGLLFLRAPVWTIPPVAIFVLFAPHYFTSEFFDTPWLWWVGLSTRTRNTFDYVPVLPWLAPFLFGMFAARPEWVRGWLARNNPVDKGKNLAVSWLTFLSRHSLVFYLVHQPILISLVYVASLVAPPPKADPAVRYIRHCNMSCEIDQRTKNFCLQFCGCTLQGLQRQNLLTPFQSGAISPDNDDRIKRIAIECTPALP